MTFNGDTVRIRDVKGMRYLARLLAEPGREYHVLDLAAAESGRDLRAQSGKVANPPHSALGNAGNILDARAKDAYRRRLRDIDYDIEEARTNGDTARLSQAETERDFLVQELARAFGLGGRARRAASASERARVAVTRSVRLAIAKITQQHSTLGAHLSHTIRTGTYCAYQPDPRAPDRW